MAAQLIKQDGNEVTRQVTVNLSGRLLEAEDKIQAAVNAVGCLATEEALKRFDADGTPIVLGKVTGTHKMSNPKPYQTPYGEVTIERHLYQTAQGGRAYGPLEHHGRIIRHATPRFAKPLAHKYAEMNVNRVCNDRLDNHGRQIAASYVQNVADWVGRMACAKEEHWDYETPSFDSVISTVVVSLDGAHMPIKEEGYKQARVGTISLYNLDKERRHTLYIGEVPESGKATFTERLTREVERVKTRYPDAQYLGLAEGAPDNWTFLEPHTDQQLLDDFHASEYLPALAKAAYPNKTDNPKREQGLNEHQHDLKHKPQFVEQRIETAKHLSNKTRLGKTVKETLHSALTSFTNQPHRMDYAGFSERNLPMGSGVTEAACTVLVKPRLCGSGMRWKIQGARVVLSLRALSHSTGRWTPFWQKVDPFGAMAY